MSNDLELPGWLELGKRFVRQPEIGLIVRCTAEGYRYPVLAARFKGGMSDGDGAGGFVWQCMRGNEVWPPPTHWRPR